MNQAFLKGRYFSDMFIHGLINTGVEILKVPKVGEVSHLAKHK